MQSDGKGRFQAMPNIVFSKAASSKSSLNRLRFTCASLAGTLHKRAPEILHQREPIIYLYIFFFFHFFFFILFYWKKNQSQTCNYLAPNMMSESVKMLAPPPNPTLSSNRRPRLCAAY